MSPPLPSREERIFSDAFDAMRCGELVIVKLATASLGIAIVERWLCDIANGRPVRKSGSVFMMRGGSSNDGFLRCIGGAASEDDVIRGYRRGHYAIVDPRTVEDGLWSPVISRAATIHWFTP